MAKQVKNGINVFEQFGFISARESGDESIGNCPFCGSADHFFLNVESANKTWSCKKCLREGGFKSFLEQIVDFCAENFTKGISAQLVKNRGISFNTFSQVRTGYHPLTNQFILPVFGIDGEVLNIKLYNFESMRNAAGCAAAMYHIWAIDWDNCKDIYICEGEWDTLALMEIAQKIGANNIGIIGVPGAGTFKQDILPMLTRKNIILLYDNDEAGQKGTEKAIQLLSSVSNKIFVLGWDSDKNEGYDIRDLLIENKHEMAYDYITQHIIEHTGAIHEEDESAFSGEIVDCSEVYQVFQKWLHIPNTELLDVIFGTVLANRLPGDPLWMFIVAPPGATKTEPLLSMSDCPAIETLSTLTPHTLISGTNFGGGGDPSLIPKLNGKVLLIKDFTTILQMPPAERDEIFGILRDAYDGEASKPFGNGIFRKYKSKFGIIAAVTPAIEYFTEDNASLGERFLRWRNYIPSKLSVRRVYIKKALGNVTHEVELREELRAIAKKVLEGKYDFIPEIPDKINEKIIYLAQLISILRGVVSRDKYTKAIQHKAFIELGTRIAKQLFKLMLGVGMFRQVEMIGESEFAIARNVARSTVPQRLFDMMQVVYKNTDGISVGDATKSMGGLPNDTCQMILDNLVMLGGAIKIQDDSGKIKYAINKEIRVYIQFSGLFD